MLKSRAVWLRESKFYKPPQESKDGTEVEEAFLVEEEAMRIEEELLGYAYLAGDLKKNAVPKTLKEAMESEDWKNWKEAMDVEMAQLNKMGTWELMKLPAGRTAIGCRWVLALKFDAAGNLQRYKARLVAQGYTQIPSINYTETYSPTICLDSQRTIFTLATIYSYDIQQMDIKTAYLYGELEEEIYMRQPEGYNDGTGRVCRLKKTLYGLKRSG
ncbi:hypothetical protein FRB96_006004 [Tulasnella sp. 330]|nr:hypothetical protein FRB96_006004 [Tulasnella sp. 330]